MAKTRVYELAKELDVPSKRIIDLLSDIGFEVKNHMSVVEDEAVKRIKYQLTGKGEPPAPLKPAAPVKEEMKDKASAAQKGQGGAQKKTERTPQKHAAKPAAAGSRPAGQNQQGTRPAGQQQKGPRPASQGQQGTRPAGQQQKGPRTAGTGQQQKSARPTGQGQRGTRPTGPGQKQRPPKREKKKRINKRERLAMREARLLDEQQKAERTVVIEGRITVGELADKLAVSAGEIISKLIELGTMATINQAVETELAQVLAEEYGFEVEVKVNTLEDSLVETVEDREEDLRTRPPVVTVLGHVDHGKTSLLDAIREANVTSQEAGGITQHIGAYQAVANGKKIVFLDTPGHAAFTAMRARGAQVTDIAIVVVAADDGVMPQTVEAINHVKAAGVPIIIAVNKIDKPNANPDRVKQQLTEYGLVPEEWGGETIFVDVSALKHLGLDTLMEMILLLSEMAELKANPDKPAIGTVVEAKLDKGRGPVATVLIQDGTLHVGDSIICGTIYGKVRAMVDDKGKRVKKAGPATPVEVLGLNDVPEAGDLLQSVSDDRVARQVADKRAEKRREVELKKTAKVSLDDLFSQIQEGEVKDLNIIIKADVQGSVEALRESLLKLTSDEVRIQVIHGGVGAITESDVMLASASNAIIIGFNVRPEPSARKMAERENVDIRLYRVIYEAIENVQAAMSGMLAPTFKEVVLGQAEVRHLFKVSKLGTIAGCHVIDGKITRNADIRVIRDGIVIHEGKMDTLKRFKDDVREVVTGYDCGILMEKFNDYKEGDILEAYTMQQVETS
ncbi:MAG: translation initiation factor IF-2 [Bacillota bacterium]|nr:translation initiation factor IF-2 [Bacillota bacterium]MDW7682533.1 translation initiation factor IF-2 [Bacillota bacterium]